MDTGYVYFFETTCGRFVKIGYSKDPYRRHGQLGTLRPTAFDCHVLGFIPGTYATERWLHSAFQAEHDNGEWFRLSRRLERFIDTLGLEVPPAVPINLPGTIRTTITRQGRRIAGDGRGRPKVMRKCPDCGKEFSGRQMLGHDCTGGKKRRKAA